VIRPPRLNGNGTVIVSAAFAGTPPPGTSRPQGHLVRWAGDTVAWLGQPPEGLFRPNTVSCDGLEMTGTASSAQQWTAYQWTAADGFSTLPKVDGLGDGPYTPMASSDDISTIWGVYQGTSSGEATVAVRWTAGSAESLFALPISTDPVPGWSGNGTVFAASSTPGGPFVQTVDSPPSYFDIPDAINGTLTAISVDGAVVGGTAGPASSAGRAYLRSANEIHELPDNAIVHAVTPSGIAVGLMPASEQSDSDMVWDRTHGARHLRAVLAQYGVQLPVGMVIVRATDISVDGRVIVGVVSHADTDLFRAVLPAGAFE